MLSYFDANVLIHASQAKREWREPAQEYFSRADRRFASSVFLRIEVIPRAKATGYREPLEIIDSILGQVSVWADCGRETLDLAFDLACEYPSLKRFDLLHLAAAISCGAQELATFESKPGRGFADIPTEVISILRLQKLAE